MGRYTSTVEDKRYGGTTQEIHAGKIVFDAAVAGVLLVAVMLGGWPQYQVYSSEMRGRAVLAEAESSRQVAVREALALKDSAKYKAEAEIIRSEGIAKANAIIGQSLESNEKYLTYLWIDMMRDTQNQIIYVPTEAGVPVTEAARLSPKPVAAQ